MLVHDLPVQLTTFVGRIDELAEIRDLLSNPDCRLLTLVGPGGMGKTRLALELAATAASFPNGAYFVPLQPLTSPEFIVSTLADSIGLQFYAGDEAQQLIDYLRPKSLLLILDNFEHLLDGADLVSQLLANAPRIKILVTSRETLNLQEEWIFPVKGMAYPDGDDDSDLDAYGAVRLFVQTARRVRPGFSLSTERQSVLRICKLVEGMPLALEMTASWLKRLPASDIARQIEHGLDILESPARNASPRHRSIRAVFEHSWDLLTEAERDVFAKLSVFRGGFRREAAEAVAGATLMLLSALVDKSLLRMDASGRYDVHELLRQYAEEKLNASAEVQRQTREKHCIHYMDFLEQWWMPVMVHMDNSAIVEITSEIKNIRLALDWALAHDSIDQYVHALNCLGMYYHFRCQFAEGEELCSQVIVKIGKAPSDLLGRCLTMQGWFVLLGSQDYDRAAHILDEAMIVAQHLDNPYLIEDILLRQSDLAVEVGHYERARELARQSVNQVKQLPDKWSITFEIAQLGYTELLLGNLDAAKKALDEAIASARRHEVATGISDAQNFLGQVDLALQNYAAAKQTFTTNLAYSKQVVYLKGEVLALIGAGESASKLAEYAEARQYLSEALQRAMQSNQLPYALQALTATAELLVQSGNSERAVEVLAAILDHHGATYQIRNRAQALLSQLEAQLVPEVVAAAVERAQCYELDKLIQSLITGELAAQPLLSTEMQRTDPGTLSERELEILRSMANGLSNREIAEHLFLATGTVKWYLSEIYSKLYVSSRTQAIARARELNLLA